MSLFDTGKLTSAQKANVDLLQQVAGKLFEGAEQLSQLQIKTLRATSDAQFDSLRGLAAARDPQAGTGTGRSGRQERTGGFGAGGGDIQIGPGNRWQRL